MRYLSGEIDDVTPEMRIEVKQARWMPLNDAAKQMAYSGERKVVLQAKEYLAKAGLSAAKQKRPSGAVKAIRAVTQNCDPCTCEKIELGVIKNAAKLLYQKDLS